MRPLVVCLVALPLLSQIFPPVPGTPGSGRVPGQRRPGTGTGTGTGIPGLPGRGGRTTTKSSEKAIPTRTVEGMLRLRDSKRLILNTDDKRTILVQLDKQTDFGQVSLDKLQPGDFVRVDAREDDGAYLFAVTVERVRVGTPEERAQAKQPLPPDAFGQQVEMDAKSSRPSMTGNTPDAVEDSEAPKIRKSGKAEAAPEEAVAEPREAYTVLKTPGGEDPDRPKLARGAKRKPTQELASAEEVLASMKDAPEPVVRETGAVRETTAPAISGPRVDPVIEKAAEAITSLSSDLPNYVVRQLTTRRYSDTAKVEWKVADVVEADLIVEDRQERYRNLKINGKPAKTRPEDSGAWSVGEFVTTPTQLLTSGAAEFKNRVEVLINGRKAFRYDYSVAQDRSGWRIEMAGQSYNPAQRGRLWLDRETSRVLRLEMEGRQFPGEFPIDKAEMTLEYDFVAIGSRKFLLPVKSEILSCHRGKPDCSLNVLEFRNYRKFEAESQLITDPR
ncbi:MAG: hypothetical protein K2X03_11665 [Bryobacteraceae bacterium]|nr:hypothetical protein [Bryobacteraceae bacterium]